MSKGWITVASKITTNMFVYRDVTVGITYTFIVRAENKYGLGSPSSMSEPVTIGKVYD